MDSEFTYSIPSEKRIHQLVGTKMIDLIKYSYEDFLEYTDYLEEVGIAGYRDWLSFFKYGYGGLLIVFDNGVEYSFGSAEDINSIVMCGQRNAEGTYRQGYIMNDADIKEAISASEMNDVHFNEITNRKIVMINVLTPIMQTSKQQGLPSEVGIEFVLENEKKLILSHNLTADSFVFSVLTDNDVLGVPTVVKHSFN